MGHKFYKALFPPMEVILKSFRVKQKAKKKKLNEFYERIKLKPIA